jgi:hypothetical protein
VLPVQNRGNPSQNFFREQFATFAIPSECPVRKPWVETNKQEAEAASKVEEEAEVEGEARDHVEVVPGQPQQQHKQN